MDTYMNRLLTVSMRIGVLMLQSGAEIYRVEDSVHRIHLAYCASESQVYCVPTTVIAPDVCQNAAARQAGADDFQTVHQFKKSLSFLLRLGWRSLRSAFASI